jgi:heterodisulfide reductase subunit C
MKELALEAGVLPESITAELEQVVGTGYAFPLTTNSERQRQELGLEPLKATEELRRIAEATGLLGLLGRLTK